MERDAIVAEIIELATAWQTGAATEDERARLERLLEDNSEARAVYLRVADDTVTLNDVRKSTHAGQAPAEPSPTAEVTKSFAAKSAPWTLGLALAASFGVVAIGLWLRRPELSAPVAGSASRSFARVVSISEVQWTDDLRAFSEWQRVGEGEILEFDAGRIEVLYDNGVQFVVQGPAKCEFLSEGQVLASSGKLVARVGPEATGFEIVTPHATVIDRGTSFGMTIDPEHQTDVVVYEGIVDLSLPESAPAHRRLNAGEAIRVGRDGHVGRIASVNGEAFLPPPRLTEAQADASPVIVSVSDNLKSSQTAKYYRVMPRGFREDCQAYVDRRHQWNGLDELGLPPFLVGADYVMTFNDDKVQHDLGMAVTLAQPSRLFLLIDDRATPPKWLTDTFVDTGWDIGSDEGYADVPEVQTAVGPGKSIEYSFSVWSLDVPAASTVMLGSLQEEATSSPPREVLRAMYGIAATPLTGAGPVPTTD